MTTSRLQTVRRHVTPVLVLRILLAAVLLNAGIGKYAREAGPVETFDQVGLGQWFRYFTGTIELASAVGLLIGPIAGLAALTAASVLAGAALTELSILTDGNPIVPAVLLALLALAPPCPHADPPHAGAPDLAPTQVPVTREPSAVLVEQDLESHARPSSAASDRQFEAARLCLSALKAARAITPRGVAGRFAGSAVAPLER